MKVEMNRGACCHVAGDIDFDSDNNLWLVTGDDTPATALGANNYPPFNDMKTNESQTVRVQGATGGTFTLTFDGQTTAPLAFNANAAAIRTALEELGNVEPGDVVVTGTGNVSTANQTVSFRGAYSQEDVPQLVADATGPHRQRHADGHDRDDAGGRLVLGAVQRCAPRLAQHQRPARQGAAHQGQRRRLLRYPAPATCSRSPRTRRARLGRRSTRWASATRSGSRSTRTASPT